MVRPYVKEGVSRAAVIVKYWRETNISSKFEKETSGEPSECEDMQHAICQNFSD